MKTLTLAALLFCAIPAQAADRCADLAAMYHLAHGLRDAGLNDAQIVAQTAVTFPTLYEFERIRAVERISSGGDLGYLSAKLVFRHVYLECKKSA